MITKIKPLEVLLRDLQEEIEYELKIDIPKPTEPTDVEATGIPESLIQYLSYMGQFKKRIEGHANLGLILPQQIATPNPNCPVQITNISGGTWNSKAEYAESLGVLIQASTLLPAHDFALVKEAYKVAIRYFGLDKTIPQDDAFYDSTEFQGNNNPQHYGFILRYFIQLGTVTQEDIDKEELQREVRKRHRDGEEDLLHFEGQKHVCIKRMIEKVNKKTKELHEYQGSIEAMQNVLTFDTQYRRSDPTIISTPDILIDAGHHAHKGIYIQYSSENAHDLRLAPLLERAVITSLAIQGKTSPEFIQYGYSSLYNSRLHTDLCVDIKNSRLAKLVDSMTQHLGMQVITKELQQ